MRQDESNFMALLVGVGIGWLSFTADGQQMIHKAVNTMKDKYLIKKDKKEVDENVNEQ